jgi:flavin reductase (DIM6/NTAB) family NADH-FMN oxidoreductase RutF
MLEEGGRVGMHAAKPLGAAEGAVDEQCIDCREAPADPQRLRQALGRFATGVTVITTRHPDGRLVGLTANSFSSVSLDPPLVLWSLRRQAPSLESFTASGWFAVNVLGAHQCDLSRQFATPHADKFATIPHEPGLGGCPLLQDSLAQFECRLQDSLLGGDHMIFIGSVERARHREGEPLIFSAGRYCTPALLADLA